MAPRVFRFSDLPAELRTRIYSYALEVESELYIISENNIIKARYRNAPNIQQENPPLINTALLRTCQQTHREATPILYGSNELGASSDTSVKFLTMIGPSIRHLRYFFLGWCAREDFVRVCGSLKEATSLVRFSSTMEPTFREDGSIEWLAQNLEPLVKAWDEAQKKATEKKGRNVLDVIVVDPGYMSSRRDDRERAVTGAKDLEKELKERLKKVLQ